MAKLFERKALFIAALYVQLQNNNSWVRFAFLIARICEHDSLFPKHHFPFMPSFFFSLFPRT